MPRTLLAIVMALAPMALADVALCHALGLAFTNWERMVTVTLAIAALGAFYQWSGRSPRIASMALWVVLWITFSVLAAIMTYAAAAYAGTLRDGLFGALDHRLGFDWAAWFAFIGHHRNVKFVLALVYDSLMPQILLSISVFAYLGWDERNGELLLSVILALIITTVFFALFPALGPCTEVRWSCDLYNLYLPDLIGLREGVPSSFDLTKLKGIIAFPSFHAALAVLFSYAHRGWRGFAPVAGLNTVMLASIPSEGGHYLVDVIAGLAVAASAILTVRLSRPHQRPVMRASPA